MNIILKKLNILNFKGIRKFEIEFNDGVNEVLGANGTGKSTLADAFYWALFGKNFSEKTDFNIKTLDENNNPIHKLTHEVEVLLTIDSEELKIKRVYKEKWTTKRGDTIEELTGHVQELYWNDVPMQLKQFNDKITSLIPGEAFKLITNPFYFTSVLSWKQRRDTLINISGCNVNEHHEIVINNPKFKKLFEAIKGKKTLDEYKKELLERKKKISEELKNINPRIDEHQRLISEIESIDFNPNKELLFKKQTELNELELMINDVNASQQEAAKGSIELQKKINQKQIDLLEIKSKIEREVIEATNKRNSEIKSLKDHINEWKKTITYNNNLINIYKLEVEALEQDLNHLREQAKELQKSQLNISNLTGFNISCHTCQRPFEGAELEEKKNELAEKSREANKAKFQSVNTLGLSKKAQKIQIEQNIKDLEFATNELELQIGENTLKLTSFENSDMKFISDEKKESAIQQLELEIENLKLGLKPLDESERLNLKNNLKQKEQLVSEIDAIKSFLSKENQISESQKRIDELKLQEKTLITELSGKEKVEDIVNQFEKESIEAVEKSVNSMFKISKFKLFNKQINGGEEQYCELTVDGVPYQDLNTASKINSGIDAINILSKHYDVTAPIFLDNSESITTIIDCKAQVIKLVVSPSHQKLTI